jgi:hypothetical protein
MKYTILDAIGKMFTANWAKSQENEKVRGFEKSAEWCLREDKFYKTGTLISLLLIVSGISIVTLGEPLLGGISMSAVGALLIGGLSKWQKQGTTATAVVKEWKPLRKELIRQGLILKVLRVFKKSNPDCNFIPESYVREVLVESIDELMSSLSAKLIEAQQEGFPKKEESLRRKMVDLRQLTRDLHLKMDFGQYFD